MEEWIACNGTTDKFIVIAEIVEKNQSRFLLTFLMTNKCISNERLVRTRKKTNYGFRLFAEEGFLFRGSLETDLLFVYIS